MDAITENLRRYGEEPYSVAVIHGGPGAGGEMAPVAQELASRWSVLEPIQTATSVNGQIIELKTVVEKNGDLPIILIGFSWGAWLSFIFAASHPSYVKKLILVGSGPIDEIYTKKVQETRINRLNDKERLEYKRLIEILNGPATETKNTAALIRLGELATKTDEYDPIKLRTEEKTLLEFRGDIFKSVWKEAAELRRSGKLLELGKHIKCSVIAIHGDHDPHPAEGVQRPLSSIISSFKFFLLKNCGHKPWIERQAREEFFSILNHELGSL